MLPYGLPYLTFVCFWRRSPFVGATTGRPRVSGVTDISPRPQKNGRPMVARTSLFLRYLYIVRRKNVIDCRHVETLPPDCHSLRPRPPPFSPPQTRFPGKRYHEQTASPNKAQRSWRSKSPEQKRRHAHKGHTAFFGAANGIRVSRELRARSSAALTVPRTVIHYRSPPNPISKKLSHPQGMREFSGAANGIRTHDLVITNDVLYRLSYSSVSNA